MDFGKAPEAATIVSVFVAALIGGLTGVFGKTAAEWLFKLILRPVQFAGEMLYRWIAPRNPFSIALRSYKKHVARSDLTRIENPVGPNLKVPLAHAFAPLKLISSATHESIELFPHAAASYRCIVLGGPGTGKTTLMKSLVTSIINGRVGEADLSDLIPVFVILRELAKNEHTVEQALVAAFHKYHFPGAEKFVESALSQGKLLIILDGLDEVGVSREYVAGQILDFCEHDGQRAHRNRLIVTCRENSYRTQDLRASIPEVVRVEPFANHHMRVFLKGWPEHRGRLAVKLYGLIQSDPQIRDICRNPLLLTILTGLYLNTDNFELPNSRDRFYRAAIDELLVQRPGRRQIKQVFNADDKRHVMERVALDRLETATPHEDPEEFTQQAIALKAAEVIRQDKVDYRELIRELVEVNGIIKPGSEGSYTCAHRTIQEYFAAREASRRREPRDVIERFGGRPELIEVLYFYCGLLNNIPSLNFILRTLAEEGRWLEAGRGLLHMREMPDPSLVERVAAELLAQIVPTAEFKTHLEVLSSLAQRQEPELEPARRYFAQAVGHLAVGFGGRGASALESALATSPEAAMKVIPGLLRHESERWRKAAVQLLQDIGTDEALDQLVLLLKDGDPYVRTEAARALAGMLKTHGNDLKARTILLPPDKDLAVWPLEDFFPGRLALPIAKALEGEQGRSGNMAINYATSALRARATGARADANLLISHWPRVMRDLKLQRHRRLAGMGFVKLGYALPLLCVLTLAALQVWGLVTDRVMVLTPADFRVQSMQAQTLRDIHRQAEVIVADIEQNYPPNAAGFFRILPWNWFVEPALPEGQDETLEAVRGWTYEFLDPYTLSDNFLWLLRLRVLRVSEDKVNEMDARLDAFERQLPAVHNARYMSVSPRFSNPAIILFFPFIIYFLGRVLRRVLMRLFGSDPYEERAESPYSFLGFRGVRYLVILVWLTLWPLIAWQGSLLPRLFPLFALIVVALAGAFLRELDWPNNPYLDAVAAVTPAKPSAPVVDIKQKDWDEEDDDDIYIGLV